MYKSEKAHKKIHLYVIIQVTIRMQRILYIQNAAICENLEFFMCKHM